MAAKRRILPFHLVDVFAVEPLTGNPLAVVDCAEELPLDLFQRIAREFNQSETTFILPPTRPDADWRLRSFTTSGVEVFGAGGHNTLGAWWWLGQSGRLALETDETTFHQEIGDRVLPLSISKVGGQLENVIMDQEAPVAGRILHDFEKLAASLGLKVADLAVDRAPCQVISTGAGHLLVPVRDRDTIDRIQPDSKALFSALKSVDGEGCYVFSLDPRQAGAHAYARFFNPTVGISEDPATGTAAGPLASHLVTNGLALPGKIRIEQGTAMGRTSVIQVEVHGDSVKVHGRGVVVASGKLTL
ncbi:PhzF family phenazine biosynthesis protein [Mesorhizobium sp. M0088]|uniref:PhzF family phenazine biosynthesis protein n=1 Tax=Mesorhizobium sp. M0088 TaxID=2956873 RepID=UPI00333517A7